MAATALLLAALAYSIDKQRSVDAKLCLQTVDNREGQRRTWNAARSLLLASQQDEETRATTNAFFDGILETIPALRCEGNRPVEVN